MSYEEGSEPVDPQEPQEREIDGYLYRVRPLPAGAGYRALLRFNRLAAPVLAAVSKATDKADKLGAFAEALQAIALHVKEDDIKFFCDTFGPYSKFRKVDVEPGLEDKWPTLVAGNLDPHFSARYQAMFGWLRFCMEVNFAGFFGDAMKSGLAAAGTTMAVTTS